MLAVEAFAIVLGATVATQASPVASSGPRRELTERQIRLRDEHGLADADFARPSPLLRRAPGLRVKSARELRLRTADTPEWRVCESAHCFFVVCGNDEAFARELVAQTEAARAIVREYFPHPELDPVPIHTAPHVVRCAKDAEQYHSYGGPSGSGGYWNPIARELLVHRERADRDATTWSALRGLVFHAYASEVWGTVELPLWFALGHADFFAGFEAVDVAPSSIAVASRITLAPAPSKAALAHWRGLDESGELVTVRALLTSPDPDPWVRREWQASAWGFVWHLRALERESPEHPHAQLLPRWFAEWLVDGDARRATDVAFAGVDLEALERTTVERIRTLGAPAGR